ncbi:MAG: polysaccharide deacetylase family protein [Spirochaetaceae bacterium]|jgi:peptidoglycan/xylan/chitin deacetylase (PgdA/CDA1 family)|nr:polysaccharide deacetylase family protein [Spirochaetaceae bacterium]
MKYFHALLCVLAVVLPLSCASRAVPRSEVPPGEAPPAGDIYQRPPEKPEKALDQALRHIKNNSPLVKKSFRLNEAAAGQKDELEIIVTGECQFEGEDFTVIYDLAGAVKTGGDRFLIPFSLEESGGGFSHSGELFFSPDDDEAGLLLSLDDDYQESWRRHFDLFEQYGARITFFVQGTQDSVAGFCDEALLRNHDIGFHTENHYDLTKVSREVFDRETIEAAENFRIPLSAFAWPFGFSQPWMREALSPVFRITRGYGANYRLYDAETVRSGYIVSKAIDNIMYPDDGHFERSIRLLLLAAKFIGGIVPFTTHEIADTAQWGIKPQRLEYVLQTTRELKLRFYTFSDFL